MVKEILDIIIVLGVNLPIKDTLKRALLDDLTNFCASKGAEKITIIETCHVLGEVPYRNRAFQISLKLTCRVKDLVKICDSISNFYLELKNLVSIIIVRISGWKGIFVKEGPQKGVIKPMDMSTEYSPSTIIEAEYVEYD